jgi:hypothetical protein
MQGRKEGRKESKKEVMTLLMSDLCSQIEIYNIDIRHKYSGKEYLAIHRSFEFKKAIGGTVRRLAVFPYWLIKIFLGTIYWKCKYSHSLVYVNLT